MTLQPEKLDEFFALARERQAIYLRRQAGQPWPWTEDPLFLRYKFTNLFRENDRTTRWFRENVRDPLRDKPEVLLATVLFRWFNRTTTGEAIFKQTGIDKDDFEPPWQKTSWERFLKTGDTRDMRAAIKSYCGSGPYVTGAYIIRGEPGMSKLDGVLACVGKFYSGEYKTYAGSLNWHEFAEMCLDTRHGGVRLRDAWEWLKEVPFLGPFMAYEIVTDLRWTGLLDSAPDINTWANPGPGAMRGLGRMRGAEWVKVGRRFAAVPREQLLDEMREILAASRDPRYWPQHKRSGLTFGGSSSIETALFKPKFWPAWELHEVEMWLCEADKMWRVKNGEGKTKSVYRRPA
jgi:hypothetical protein